MDDDNLNVDNYYVKQNFHKAVKAVVEEKYPLQVQWTKVIAWGYQTVCLYMEDNHQNKYVIKYTKANEQKLAKISKSIHLEHYLTIKLPTPEYIKNNEGGFITQFNTDHVLRLQHHLEGIPPYDMTWEIFDQAIEKLQILHQMPIPTEVEIEQYINNDLASTLEETDYVLLHGDLTPSNILISFGRITGILDFEESLIGPAEYDLARLAVFSGYYMQDVTFDDLWNRCKTTYQLRKLNKVVFVSTALEHLQERLQNLGAHKESYDNLGDWEADLQFTQDKLEEILAFRKNL